MSACTTPMSIQNLQYKPVVFVHGNGDSAALWLTTVWRFESNGWPANLLHTMDVPYPLARDADDKPQAGRSSTAEHMQVLKDKVDAVLAQTGAKQVILIGNSRGGNAIRNYICNGGGAQRVSHAIIGGGTHHGVQAIPGLNDASEFSGAGLFLKQLNAPKNSQGDEICGPTQWMTIRSDNNDKYAQPDGLWIGMKGRATMVGFDGPELKGALNVVIPKIDHRETSFSPAAFEASYQFLTGHAPMHNITTQSQIELNGKVFGLGVNPLQADSGNFVNNLPLQGAKLSIYETDTHTGQRRGAAVHQSSISSDGHWGPFKANSRAAYEFELTADGYATTHIYRSPFARSSNIVHMRPERLAASDRTTQSLVIWTRPRGYFDANRDAMMLDGKTDIPGVAKGMSAGISSVRIRMDESPQRSVAAEFNGEQLKGLTWPASQGHITVLELTY
ncbi:twin-arginine translocation pathway signal [Limnohabitans sp. Hippo4]|nr:twin-arginine translocation pathway signal [Limnohabitans sp. Hippo4]